MKIEKYLVISASEARYGGFNSHVKLVEREPKLKGNEISLRLNLEIPDAVFKRPKLEAKLSVPDTAVSKIAITPDVTDNIERIIKETTGLTMHVGIVEHPEPKEEEEQE